MNKGINTVILEGRQLMANTVNKLLEEGVPPTVLSMIIEGLYKELNSIVNKTIEKEKEQIENQKELEGSQVLYEPEEEQSSNEE